ncbi:MAG: enoyl-CoA hydratase/isomerase family protein [Thermoproteota archaeon]
MAIQGYYTVEVAKEGKLGWITLNRPDKLNALNRAMLNELLKALSEMRDSPDVKIVVITGRGKAFSAGIDLKELASSSSPDEAEELFAKLAEVFEAVMSFPKPVIIALNGHAYGGGAELLWAADIVVSVKGVKIGWPEARWNLVPPALPFYGVFSLGPARAAYIALTSGELTSEEAYKLGLVSVLVDSQEELVDAVREVAVRIMANSPDAVSSIKAMLLQAKRSLPVGYGVAELRRLARYKKAIDAARAFAERKEMPSYDW